jgi:rfaE bifunctional protein kinase chain/domain
MIDRAYLQMVVPQLSDCHILVIGDLFLDEYLIGRATRLSREAPIPVLDFVEQRQLPGGGANPSVNVVALGAQVTQVGVIGNDDAGQVLMGLLLNRGIGADGIVVDPDRPTTTKTRLVAKGSLRFPQQVARIDKVDRQPLSQGIEAHIVARIAELAERANAILISDYGSGLVTPGVVAAVRRARNPERIICVDTQGRLGHFAGFDLAKCNHVEAQGYMERAFRRSLPLESERDFEEAMTRLQSELNLGALLISRGPEGLSVHSGAGYVHLPAANVSEVYDVTGAGDTVVAVASLALAAGQTPNTAAALANLAAGLVVRKLGVAAPSPSELAWAIDNW